MPHPANLIDEAGTVGSTATREKDAELARKVP
jgi:hypothetical protein